MHLSTGSTNELSRPLSSSQIVPLPTTNGFDLQTLPRRGAQTEASAPPQQAPLPRQRGLQLQVRLWLGELVSRERSEVVGFPQGLGRGPPPAPGSAPDGVKKRSLQYQRSGCGACSREAEVRHKHELTLTGTLPLYMSRNHPSQTRLY